MVNVGQLARELYGERPTDQLGVFLVGFGTHRGTVIAGSEWGADMERMRLPTARKGSWEHVVHEAVGGDALFVFDGSADGGIAGLAEPIDPARVLRG